MTDFMRQAWERFRSSQSAPATSWRGDPRSAADAFDVPEGQSCAGPGSTDTAANSVEAHRELADLALGLDQTAILLGPRPGLQPFAAGGQEVLTQAEIRRAG